MIEHGREVLEQVRAHDGLQHIGGQHDTEDQRECVGLLGLGNVTFLARLSQTLFGGIELLLTTVILFGHGSAHIQPTTCSARSFQAMRRPATESARSMVPAPTMKGAPTKATISEGSALFMNPRQML